MLLVVPCYNEERRLDRERFASALEQDPGLELCLVDDGSRDGTRKLLQELAARSDRAFVVALDRNQGKAEAVRRGVLAGLERSAAGYVGSGDADLASPFSELERFVARLESAPELELVIGARVKLLGRRVSRRAHRHYLGRVFATGAAAALGVAVYDTQCGAKVFRRGAGFATLWQQPFQARWLFDVELLFRLARELAPAGRRLEDAVYELDLSEWRDRGASKVRALDFPRSAFELLRITLHYRRGRRVSST